MGPYRANSNQPGGPTATWSIYGEPDTSSIEIFFSSIQVQYPNDYIQVKDSQGNLAWQTWAGTYTNQWVTVWSHSARIELYSDGTDQRDGFYVTKFVQNWHHWFPVQGVTVYAYDDDTYSGDDPLGSAVTDSQGYFSITNIPNDHESWPEGGTLDVYCKLWSYSDHAIVVMSGGGAYGMTTDVQGNVEDGDVNFYDIAPSEATNTAWIAYSNVNDCWNTFANGGPGYQAPQIKAVWTSGHNANYHWGCPSGTHTDTGGLYPGEIHLNSVDGQVVDTVLHEAGHVIMFREYDNWVPGETTNHFYTLNYGENFAWTEGWADFVPAAVGLYTGKGDAYFDTGNLGLLGYQYSMETAQQLESGIYPGDAEWLGGDTNEATISYALYDIYDSNDDGTDYFDGGLNGIWTVFDDRRINDFSDFYDAFREHYYSSQAYYASCHNAIKQGSRGTISYDPVTLMEDCGDIPDWTLSQVGGAVSLDSDPNLAPVPTPCMRLETYNPNTGEVSAAHHFPTQGGDFVVDVKVRPDDTIGHNYIWIMNTGPTNAFGAYIAFQNGQISYYSTGPNWHDIMAFSADTWYQLTFSIHASSGTFDLFVNGVSKVTGAAFYDDGSSSNHYLNLVKFRAGYAGQAEVKYWVDDITIRVGAGMFCDQFVEDYVGWTRVQTAGTVDRDSYSGSWVYPSARLNRQQTDPSKQCQAFHSVSTSSKTSGRIYLEARVSVDTIGSYKWCYVNLYDSGGVVETYLVLRDGYICYYTGSWVYTSYTYSAGSWFKIGLDADLETGTYDIYANGAKIVSGAPLWDPGTAHNILKVGLQAGAANLSGMTLHCDDIVVTWR